MSEQTDPELVRIWVDRLRTGSETEKRRAASELGLIQLRKRGAIRTRGGMSYAAPNEFADLTQREDLKTLIDALRDESPAVRRAVALSLGEWGDEQAAAILSQIVNGPPGDPDEQVRGAAIAALGVIGGPTAVLTLLRVLDDIASSESLCSAALGALTQIKLGSGQAPRLRGTSDIRTRGSARMPRAGSGFEEPMADVTLARFRDDLSRPEYLRRMADAVLNAVPE
jgi:HEAT repeat protein